MKTIKFFLFALIVACLTLTSCSAGLANQPSASAPQATVSTSTHDSSGGNFTIESNTLGEKPANSENIDQKVYTKPYTVGTITNAEGNGVWTQSGKNGKAKLHGSVPTGSYLEVDAYSLTKDGKTYSGGIIIIVAGPLDLEKANVSYQDGGANLVTGDIQAFIDDNLFGKFCRGDLIVDQTTKLPVLDANGDLQFKYKPWALTYRQLGGYKMSPLNSCPKSRADDHTSYPTP